VNCSDVELRRCTAAQVARVLEAMTGEPLRIVLHQRWGSGLVPVEWRRVRLWLLRQGDGWVVWRAELPGPQGVEQWELGCERDDWTLGPDAVVVEPLRLLTRESRGQLLGVLAAADVELSGVVIPGPAVA
jgi:hypothetical protein